MNSFLIRLSTTLKDFAIKEMEILLHNYTILSQDFPFYVIETTIENINFYVERSIFCKNIDYFIKKENLNDVLQRIKLGLTIESNYVKNKKGTLIHVTSYGNKIKGLRDKLIEYSYSLNFKIEKTSKNEQSNNESIDNGQSKNDKNSDDQSSNGQSNNDSIVNDQTIKDSIDNDINDNINQNDANGIEKNYKSFNSPESQPKVDRSEITVTTTQDFIYFGEKYCTTNRKRFLKWGIKNRNFIGHTSLDLELSIFMINACRLKRNSIILDPCCGSCSILHAASIFGIYGIGTEIQKKELIGRNEIKNNSRTLVKGYDVYSNFYQFGVMVNILGICVGDLFNLPVKTVLISGNDNYKNGNKRQSLKNKGETSHLSKKILINAVLTDPPYGIRASIKGNILDYYKKLLTIGQYSEYIGFWAISDLKKDILKIFRYFKLICSVEQKLANYSRTVFIYKMNGD
ncbi:tRNA (guanine(10)-N2)-methyltransferase [Dictyocoela muelleri]|nr:tRNA (guanine(10)-N2)-methyltransferase [Dictyocoela muelleri]